MTMTPRQIASRPMMGRQHGTCRSLKGVITEEVDWIIGSWELAGWLCCCGLAVVLSLLLHIIKKALLYILSLTLLNDRIQAVSVRIHMVQYCIVNHSVEEKQNRYISSTLYIFRFVVYIYERFLWWSGACWMVLFNLGNSNFHLLCGCSCSGRPVLWWGTRVEVRLPQTR